MVELSKAQLLSAPAGSVDTDALSFTGLRGAQSRHLSHAQLELALARLPPAPKDVGSLELLVARGPSGERELPSSVVLTRDGGMPGDRWVTEARYGPQYQLATMRADCARLIANGQPMELHGDNLFVQLDLSGSNLPVGSVVRIGEAHLRVTTQAHNGCKKWVQRFGLAAMQLNLDARYRHLHLRGIYLQVIQDGRAQLGDEIVVLRRSD
jgi:hypothetical protein